MNPNQNNEMNISKIITNHCAQLNRASIALRVQSGRVTLDEISKVIATDINRVAQNDLIALSKQMPMMDYIKVIKSIPGRVLVEIS